MNKDWVYRRGDIYFADLGDRLGCEQTGTRPILVIQNDIGNKFAPTLTVLPITSNIKKMTLPTHTVLPPDTVLKRESMVMAEQIVTIDKNRVLSYVGQLDNIHLNSVMEAVQIHIGVH